MPYNFGIKSCLNCDKEIILKIKRDLTRKKYCSHSCRQIHKQETDPRYKEVQKENAIKLQSFEIKFHPGKSNKGEKNGRYKRDRNTVKRPLVSMEGNNWRKQVFERDNYTCKECGQIGGKLNADHIKPYCAYPDLRWDINNGRTLCVECHKKTDTYGSKAWKYKEIA